ncbi:MAG: GIN domain-containing protein [Gammaproteobacteria bacterium]
MRNSIIGTLIIFSIFLSGCDQKVVSGNERISTEKRTLKDQYTKLNISGLYRVNIYANDNSDKIKLEADNNLFPFIHTTVKHDTLFIRNRHKTTLKPSQPMHIDINHRNIDDVNYRGKGSVDIHSIRANKLRVAHYGTGSCYVKGHIKELTVEINGKGSCQLTGSANQSLFVLKGKGGINAMNMVIKNARVEINGNGDVYIDAKKTLNVTINGNGSVRYAGHPHISQTIHGRGKVTPATSDE